MSPTYSVHENAEDADLEVVDRGLDRHNRAERELENVRRLSVLAKDASGTVIGGAVGRTWGTCCELLQLWVSEAERRHGVGSRLVALFEREAARRGCTLVYLTTFSFQSPSFYASSGYAVVHETSGYTGGIVRYTMQKQLASREGANGSSATSPPPRGS